VVGIFSRCRPGQVGFTTVPLSAAAISEAGMLLMMDPDVFIGASPRGTGGGHQEPPTFAALVAATALHAEGLDTGGDPPAAISERWCCGRWESPWPRCCSCC